jgi:hypothetical protein
MMIQIKKIDITILNKYVKENLMDIKVNNQDEIIE